MTEDISYSYREAWNDCFVNGEESGIVNAPQDVNNHTPIGDYYYAFSGNFDGKCHVISGIRIVKILNGIKPFTWLLQIPIIKKFYIKRGSSVEQIEAAADSVTNDPVIGISKWSADRLMMLSLFFWLLL